MHSRRRGALVASLLTTTNALDVVLSERRGSGALLAHGGVGPHVVIEAFKGEGLKNCSQQIDSSSLQQAAAVSVCRYAKPAEAFKTIVC